MQPPNLICPDSLTTPSNASTISMPDLVCVEDNSICEVTFTCDWPVDNTFPVGVTTVICNAVDESGNQAQCSFNITVTGRTFSCELRHSTHMRLNISKGTSCRKTGF